jgi:peptidoglycan/LPS O-acetylase OafA/YrhL
MNRPKDQIGFLDEMRGIAILSVFLFHSLQAACGRDQLPWGDWFRNFNVSSTFLSLLPLSLGWAGVPIFFVVSGFCIHLSFIRKPEWRDFFIRRLFRIYPPYFFAVILFALVLPWSHINYGLLGIGQLLSHLLLIHNFDNRFFWAISPSLWSIAVEVQLYLLYPILLYLISRLGWYRTLSCVAALEIGLRLLASIVLMTTGQPLPLWFEGLPILYWYSWSIGAAIAESYVLRLPIPFANHSLMGWSIVAVFSTFVKAFDAFAFLFFSLLAATMIAKLLQNPLTSSLFPTSLAKPLRTIGLWSYSIYLLHHPLIESISLIIPKLSLPADIQSWIVFVVCLGLGIPIVALSALWYHIFEIPSVAASKRIIANFK